MGALSPSFLSFVGNYTLSHTAHPSSPLTVAKKIPLLKLLGSWKSWALLPNILPRWGIPQLLTFLGRDKGKLSEDDSSRHSLTTSSSHPFFPPNPILSTCHKVELGACEAKGVACPHNRPCSPPTRLPALSLCSGSVAGKPGKGRVVRTVHLISFSFACPILLQCVWS